MERGSSSHEVLGNSVKIECGKLNIRDYSKDLVVCGSIVLQVAFKNSAQSHVINFKYK